MVFLRFGWRLDDVSMICYDSCGGYGSAAGNDDRGCFRCRADAYSGFCAAVRIVGGFVFRGCTDAVESVKVCFSFFLLKIVYC